MPLVSVIIPVYNHAHTLERCLGTLALQAKEQDLEVIIVNDGSTDGFEKEMERILKNNANIAVLNPKIINQENKGAPVARNRGAKEANGEYIIFWDADTIAKQQMIHKMRLALEKNPVASYAYSQFRFGLKKIKSHEFDKALLKTVNYIDTTSLIRRKVLVPFDESLKKFQDWDLWLTMLEQNKIGVFVSEVLYKKITRGRKGYSDWMPSFLFKLPLKIGSVENYEIAKQIILEKHKI